MNRLFMEERDLDPDVIEHYDSLLKYAKIDFKKENLEENKCFLSVPVSFGGGVEAKIMVFSNRTRLFVQPKLFQNGSKISSLENRDRLDGEYRFQHEGKTYLAVLAPKDPESEYRGRHWNPNEDNSI